MAARYSGLVTSLNSGLIWLTAQPSVSKPSADHFLRPSRWLKKNWYSRPLQTMRMLISTRYDTGSKNTRFRKKSELYMVYTNAGTAKYTPMLNWPRMFDASRPHCVMGML